MKHIVIIPYYCDEEVRRYRMIANFLKEMTETNIPFEFLLCSGPSVRPSDALSDLFSKIAPTRSYACRTQVTGYPERPTAMFWEIMGHVNNTCEQDGGFALWLESDMLPIKKKWIDRLQREWLRMKETLLMGLYISQWKMPNRSIVRAHINGGACYAKNIIRFVPPEGRKPCFDIQLFPSIQATGRYLYSNQFVFTTHDTIPAHMKDPQKTILHGYLQNKDKFIQECIAHFQHPETSNKQTFKWLRPILRYTKWGRCCELRHRKGIFLYCPIHSSRVKLLDRFLEAARRKVKNNFWLNKQLMMWSVQLDLNKKWLFLVYSMGKTGSRTIVESLENLSQDYAVYHIHSLGNKIDYQREAFHKTGRMIKHVVVSEKLRRKIKKGFDLKKFKVVTSVRDPIAQRAASFFENLYQHHAISREKIKTLSQEDAVRELIPIFLEFLPKRNEFVWFNEELKRYLGVDVYAKEDRKSVV